MCLNFGLVPMFYDSLTEKNHLEFRLADPLIDFVKYKDLESYTIDFLIYYHNSQDPKLNYLKKYCRFVRFVPLPCGKCPQCMNNKAKEIMFRIIQESKEHKSNYFITLTYDDEHLPDNYSLVKDEISKFNKKLKVYLTRKNKKSDFRFYGVGEYGGKTARPHYHVIYFGLELDDLEFLKTTDEGNLLFTSQFLSDVWAKGFVTIGEVTPNSAAYVARYTEKKQLLTKEEKNKFLDLGFIPEFSVQSMRPGIGANFYKNCVVSFSKECYTYNIKGSSFFLPKYYRNKLKKDPEVPQELIDKFESSNFDAFSASFSSSVLYYGDERRNINKSQIFDILKAKKQRKCL